MEGWRASQDKTHLSRKKERKKSVRVALKIQDVRFIVSMMMADE